ncbi:MAG: hypothetical protein LBC18_13640 [Opitutaceae bacterium]|jgi:hypothetical protein|nr:hypothetical protein [Opitutaceae bacterium]
MITSFPPRLNPGDPITAAWLNQFLAAARAGMPLEGKGVSLAHGVSGTVISTRAQPHAAVKATAPAATVPVYLSPVLVVKTTGTGAAAKSVVCWSVTPGTINNRYPTTATGTVSQAAKNIADWAVPCTGDGNICAKVTVSADYSAFTAFEIVFRAEDPPMNEAAATVSERIIGQVWKTTTNGTDVWSVRSFNDQNIYVLNAGTHFDWGWV